MKTVNIRKKLLCTYAAILILLILCTSITFIFIFSNNEDNSTALKKEKVIVNEALFYIEDNYQRITETNQAAELSKLLSRNNIAAAVLDLRGELLFNSYPDNHYSINEPINIKYVNAEDSVDFTYVTPIIKNNETLGNCIFYIPKASVNSPNKQKNIYSFIPIILGIIVSAFLLLTSYIFTKKYVLKPIEGLNKFSDNIAKGNFNNRLEFNVDSEVTKLYSDLELMQEELKYSLEMQLKLEKERKEIIACISHDLRTPLSSIKAYVGAIKDGYAKDAESLNNFVEIIDNKTDSISKLIDDFFEHSKAELGELRINRTPCYSRAIINKAIDTYAVELIDNNLNFIVDNTIPDILIDVDPLRIEQVISNLLENAKKYTPSGGTINFGVTLEDKFLKCYVKDTGIGISDFDFPYIFDKFFRGANASEDTYQEGTGLGLSICKYIIEAHGGEIYAESKVNEGSTFYFTIPKI